MFDTAKFIHLVEARDCLWKISNKSFSNRKFKMKAWHEVGQEMFTAWNTFSPNKKMSICLELQNKWRNIRNTLMRFLRQKKAGAPRSRRKNYMFYDILQFMLPQEERSITIEDSPEAAYSSESIKDEVSIKENIESNEYDESIDSNLQDWYQDTIQQEIENSLENEADNICRLDDSSMHENFCTQDTIQQEIENSLENETDNNCTLEDSGTQENINTNSLEQKLITVLSKVAETDEDTSFFNSLLPSVRKLNSQQKIDFRLEVLYVLKKFQNADVDSLKSRGNGSQIINSYKDISGNCM